MVGVLFCPHLDRHIPPNDQKLSAENIRYGEFDIPRELATYTPQLSNITSHLLPVRDMVNYIRKEFAPAAAKGATFAPYLAPKLSEAPRTPVGADHGAARSRWVAFSKQAKRPLLPHDFSIRAFLPYQLRLVSAADVFRHGAFLSAYDRIFRISHRAPLIHYGVSVGFPFLPPLSRPEASGGS